MADNTPDWNLYRSFLAVMTTGSLSGAARALGLAQPTVGRHVEALEQALGASLFTRSPGGLLPTDAALALRPHAETMAVAADALVRTASGESDAVRGTVRLTASEIVGAEVLPPMLTDFHERYAKVELELVLSNQQADLLRRDSDIAVRMARPTQGALFARRVGSVRLTFYAHQRYLQKHGEPRSMEDLTGHTLIGFDRAQPSLRSLDETGLTISREMFAFRTDNDLAQLAALRAGLGICACQPAIAMREPALVPILTDKFAFDLEVWVVMHEDLKQVRRMRLLFDHLVAGLKDYVAVR